MKIPRLKIKEIKQFLKKLPRTLGERSFKTFLGLLLITLIFSGFIFYKYSFLAEKGKLEALEKPLKFNEKIYQEVLKVWQEKEKKFEEANFKEYPDPFR
jgi:predicted DNA-binding transcriptional regulator